MRGTVITIAESQAVEKAESDVTTTLDEGRNTPDNAAPSARTIWLWSSAPVPFREFSPHRDWHKIEPSAGDLTAGSTSRRDSPRLVLRRTEESRERAS